MNEPLSDAEVIEFFHLVFLQVLQARLDQARYVVKGGANLRYFFQSVRYSEDIDLDAIEIEPWKLEAKVDEVLASPATGLLLRSSRYQTLLWPRTRCALPRCCTTRQMPRSSKR